MLKQLIQEGEEFKKTLRKDADSIFKYVKHTEFENWKRKSLLTLQMHFPTSNQISDFEKIIGCSTSYDLETMIAILKAFDEVQQPKVKRNYTDQLDNIFRKFPKICNQLKGVIMGEQQ